MAGRDADERGILIFPFSRSGARGVRGGQIKLKATKERWSFRKKRPATAFAIVDQKPDDHVRQDAHGSFSPADHRADCKQDR